MPPGEFLIAFPPRRGSGDSRTTDRTYILAVTEFGLWGILDFSATRLFLDEPDLLRLYRSGSSFGMVVQPETNVLGGGTTTPIPVTLTRGEFVRLSQLSPERAVVDFGSDLHAHAQRRQQIVTHGLQVSRTGGTAVPESVLGAIAAAPLEVPRDVVEPLRIRDLVGESELQNWLRNRADYGRIFLGAFRSIRVRNDLVLASVCGREISVTNTASAEGSKRWSIGASLESVLAEVFRFLTPRFTLEVEASEAEKLSRSVVTSLKKTEMLHLEVRPVHLRSIGTPAETIAVIGEVRSCAGSPTRRSFMVQLGSLRRFLHEWMQRADDGDRPDPGEWDNDPTTLALASLPGGTPLDAHLGIHLTFRCWAQQARFEEFAARHRFGLGFDPALIRLLSVRYGLAERNLNGFFAACP